jgi:hypothetical protein
MSAADWREETRRGDALADALLAGDETAAAMAVAGLDDVTRARVAGRARLIAEWMRFAGED